MSNIGALFDELGKALAADPSIVKKVNAIYQWDISGKQWTVDLKNGNGGIKEGPAGSPDCTITTDEETFIGLLTGKANPQQAFMSGKLKLKGNMALAMKLNVLFSAKRNEVVNAPAPAPAAAAAPAPAASAPSAGGFKSDAIFAELGRRLKSEPQLVKSINTLYQFNITGAGGAQKSWTVDLKNGDGAVKEGAATNADCTITVADDDYVALMTGNANPQQLFMSGKLKIKGNMAGAMKLNQLMASRKAAL